MLPNGGIHTVEDKLSKKSSSSYYWDEKLNQQLLQEFIQVKHRSPQNEYQLEKLKKEISSNIYIVVQTHVWNLIYRNSFFKQKYSYLQAKTGILAEDVVQDIIIKIWEAILAKFLDREEFDLSKGTLHNYLLKIIGNNLKWRFTKVLEVNTKYKQSHKEIPFTALGDGKYKTVTYIIDLYHQVEDIPSVIFQTEINVPSTIYYYFVWFLIAYNLLNIYMEEHEEYYKYYDYFKAFVIAFFVTTVLYRVLAMYASLYFEEEKVFQQTGALTKEVYLINILQYIEKLLDDSLFEEVKILFLYFLKHYRKSIFRYFEKGMYGKKEVSFFNFLKILLVKTGKKPAGIFYIGILDKEEWYLIQTVFTNIIKQSHKLVDALSLSSSSVNREDIIQTFINTLKQSFTTQTSLTLFTTYLSNKDVIHNVNDSLKELFKERE